MIGEVLDRALGRFPAATQDLLAAAALAGAGTPLAVLAAATSTTTAEATDLLAPAVAAGVLDEVARTGVRFHHALLAEAAERLVDARSVHARLAAVWEATGGLDGRAAAAEHRIHAAVGPSEIAEAAAAARKLAAELVGEQQAQAARLLRAAHGAAVECVDRPDLRASIALDLAKAVRRLGDLDLALEHYQEAAKLARDSSDLVLRARTEVGAHLWVNAFVPDPTRLRRLEAVLADLPADELRLRAEVLGRLAVVGGADLDDVDRARVWADEALDVARRIGDPVLVAQALLNRTMAPGSRAELDTRLVVADEVVGLAERAGRSDLAYYGHQRRFCHHLNRGDVGAANHAMERAELLAGLLPSPGWRHRALVRRTTLLALVGSRQAAMASMDEAVQIGTGPIEPIILLSCELLHRLMLVELYGGTDPRAEELYRTLVPLIDDVPSAILQVQKGFAAQRLGDEARVQDVLLRYGREPERVLRSLSGDQYLRMLCDTIARAGATSLVGPAYDALLPYAGLLNVGGAESVGLPVDDVLGRLAALAGDVPAAVRHARDAVALARSLPSPPMLVHCLDHLADALARAGDGDSGPRAPRPPPLALAAGVERAGREARRDHPRRHEVGDPAPGGPAVGADLTPGRRPAGRQHRPGPARPAAGRHRRGGGRRRAGRPGLRAGRRRPRPRPRRAGQAGVPAAPGRAASRGRRCRGLQRPRPGRTGPRGDRRAPAGAQAGGRPRWTRPADGVGRRAGPGQRGAQPPARHHRHRPAGPRTGGGTSRCRCAPAGTAATRPSRPPRCPGPWTAEARPT